uniref:Uncharacterized protein n=1 Tax=Meloidogyne javanica TaxID=6303 RepID=A0A915LIA9_MELJA
MKIQGLHVLHAQHGQRIAWPCMEWLACGCFVRLRHWAEKWPNDDLQLCSSSCALRCQHGWELLGQWMEPCMALVWFLGFFNLGEKLGGGMILVRCGARLHGRQLVYMVAHQQLQPSW